jgi:hypothetical protein
MKRPKTENAKTRSWLGFLSRLRLSPTGPSSSSPSSSFSFSYSQSEKQTLVLPRAMKCQDLLRGSFNEAYPLRTKS